MKNKTGVLGISQIGNPEAIPPTGRLDGGIRCDDVEMVRSVIPSEFAVDHIFLKSLDPPATSAE